MIIDRSCIYIYGKYTYINFTLLSSEELLEILEWRNHPNVRKHLNTTNVISEEEHLIFCESLKNTSEKYYWMVKKGDRPIGVLNIIHVNYEDETCESGFYLIPNLVGSGEGLFAMCNYKTFLLSELKFKGVYGHNYYDNMSALVITMFFGAKINDVKNINGKLCVETFLTEETLQNGEGSQKLLLKFSTFVKNWNADQAINEFINEKVKAVLENEMTPILCIGEKLEDRENGKTAIVTETQIREGLAGITPEQAKNIIVAYEPVWAIGTGKTATPEMAQETHKQIREVLKDMFGTVAEEMIIQYGGSMKPGNAKKLLAQPDIDGGLIGGASLEADSFAQIISAARK